MPVSRRRFLRSALTATLAAPLAGSLGLSPLARAARPDGPFEMLRRGVGTFSGRGGTIGFLATADALVVVDTQFADTAAQFWSGVTAAGGAAPGRAGIDLLVNTHHHGDHTAGNAVLAPHAARHVAHAAVYGLQRAAAVQGGTLATQAFPTETFTDTWRVDVGGGETVALRHVEPAHTAGDAVVHFERANVVHMGDLVFNRMTPFVDLAGGASTAGWMRTLERLEADFDDETLFVFGHGAPGFGITGQRADLRIMRDFLGALSAFVADARTAGKTADEVAATERLPGFPDHFSETRRQALPNALRAVYTEQSRRAAGR